MIFGLRFPVERDAASVAPQGDTPLTPACGNCENGRTCQINGSPDCCSGTGTACSKCRVCSPKRGGGIVIEPELP